MTARLPDIERNERQGVSPPGPDSVPSIEAEPVEPVLLGKVSGRRTLLSWVTGLLGFLALILAVLHFASLERIIELARSARPAWLCLAVHAQAATYVSAALVWGQALHHTGHPQALRTLIPFGVAKLFTDQVLSSGSISGAMLVVTGRIRRRVPPEVAMAAMLVGLVSYDIAYLMIVLSSFGILWLHDRANLPLTIGVAIFTVITVAIPAAVLSLRRWGERQPIAWLSKLLGMAGLFRALGEAPTDLLRSPGLLIQTVGLQVAIFVLDALTLWLVFNSIGEVPEIWVVVFVSFAIASMVATIGPIPVGLGTFEAGSVSMLSFLGVSIEAAPWRGRFCCGRLRSGSRCSRVFGSPGASSPAHDRGPASASTN
jgi:glycosyltransferase 2 family protein